MLNLSIKLGTKSGSNQKWFQVNHGDESFDSNLHFEKNAPVIAVTYPHATLNESRTYNCSVLFKIPNTKRQEKRVSNTTLVVWGTTCSLSFCFNLVSALISREISIRCFCAEPPDTPSAPDITSVQFEENTPFRVTCRDVVGDPSRKLQLVSNSSKLNSFVLVAGNCGDRLPSCYRFNGIPLRTERISDLVAAARSERVRRRRGALVPRSGRAQLLELVGAAALCQRDHSLCWLLCVSTFA